MNLDSLIDFANDASNEIGKYILQITLPPAKIIADDYPIADLVWGSIKYGAEDVENIPDDKRGIYAFAICHENEILPPHGYILYIGIAGRDSERSLRDRYTDYLNVRKVMKRARIARMIGHWHEVLRFFYAPISDDISSKELQELEKKLNSALLPPFSEGDLDADTKNKRRAFR